MSLNSSIEKIIENQVSSEKSIGLKPNQQPVIGKQSLNSMHQVLISKLTYSVAILIVVAILSVPVIYMMGSKSLHKHNMHLLYDTFEESQQHKNLVKALNKAQYSVIFGSKQDGLFNFVDHFANKQLLKQRNVIVQQFHTTVSGMIQFAEQFKYKVEQALNLQARHKNLWILISRTGFNIPKRAILKIIHRNPKDKILVAITRKQRLPNFQIFQYPSITEHDIKQSIQRNFQMDQNIADILYDFFGTPQAAFEGLDIGHYNQEELLGQDYREFIQFEQEDIRILRDLCKRGQANAQGISDNLVQFGLTSWQGKTYWTNINFMLNYELHKKVRCASQGVVSEQVLFQMQQDLQNEQQHKQSQEKVIQEEWRDDQIPTKKQKDKKK